LLKVQGIKQVICQLNHLKSKLDILREAKFESYLSQVETGIQVFLNPEYSHWICVLPSTVLVCNFQLQPINICFEILFFIRRNRTSWWHQNIEQEIFPLFLDIFAFIHRSLLIINYNSVLILALAVACKTCACHFIYSAIRWLCVCLSVSFKADGCT